MASPGCIASSLKHLCWNPRKADFFPSFEAEIELDKNVMRPFKAISGRLKLSTSRLIRFRGGIRVQLDGIVRLRFQNKVDNRQSTHWAMESILKDAPDSNEGNYVKSPLMVQVLGNEDDVTQPCNMEPGEYCYPFTLPVTGFEPLPSPFRSQFGSLEYHVVAYMGSPYCYVHVAEHPVHFGGFLDLTQIPQASEPLSFTSSLHNSIFSSKPLATFTLTSEKSGYHPGDTISFTFAIHNPKGKKLKRVKVSLVRKAIYTAQGASKTTSTQLDSFERDDAGSTSTVILTGDLDLPKPCVPSYSGKYVYAVKYFILYEAAVEGHPGVGKGEAEVIVGTTKPSAISLVNGLSQSDRRGSVGGALKEEPEKGRPRSYSICSKSNMHPLSLKDHDMHGPPTQGPRRTLSMMSVRDLA